MGLGDGATMAIMAITTPMAGGIIGPGDGNTKDSSMAGTTGPKDGGTPATIALMDGRPIDDK